MGGLRFVYIHWIFAFSIIVPEPGTTAAGVGMVALGVNSLGDGFSQLAGANQGNGYNVLQDAYGAAGKSVANLAGLDPAVGRKVGKGVFLVCSVAFGGIGSIKLPNIKSLSSIRLGVGGSREVRKSDALP